MRGETPRFKGYMTENSEHTEAPPVNNTPARNPLTHEDITTGYVLFGFFTVLAFLALLGGIVAYARVAPDFLEGLDETIGENVALRARTLADAGYTEEAIAKYREALDTPFEDPRQKAWAQRRFGVLLQEQNELDEAAEILRASLETYPDDLVTHGRLTVTLRQAERFEEGAEAARDWAETAEAQNEVENEAHAWTNLGLCLQELGREDEALEAFETGHQLVPGSANSFHAAQILERRGHVGDARDHYEAYLEEGEGWRLEKAQERVDALSGDTNDADS
ncbi:MAG: tetratricopeptide repeat protein [Candidatus Hydrogenedentota bacterium]